MSTRRTRNMTDYAHLIKGSLKGNAIAQKQLYQQLAPEMLGVCYRYTKSLHDAEDVLQDGFIKVFRFLHQYKGDGEFAAWVRRIMVTTALNYLKKNQLYQQELLFEKTEMMLVAQEDPQILLQAKELAELIRQLPTGYQTIFNLNAVEGYSHVEIGRMLGISENTSRSQYMRARNLLISWITNSRDSKNRLYANK